MRYRLLVAHAVELNGNPVVEREGVPGEPPARPQRGGHPLEDPPPARPARHVQQGTERVRGSRQVARRAGR
jgi:hypothetical protein